MAQQQEIALKSGLFNSFNSKLHYFKGDIKFGNALTSDSLLTSTHVLVPVITMPES